jgi:hypothetical protein
MLFDWLVIGQIVPTNPAAAVRGPKHVVKTGKTPEISRFFPCRNQAQKLQSDRAVIGSMRAANRRLAIPRSISTSSTASPIGR